MDIPVDVEHLEAKRRDVLGNSFCVPVARRLLRGIFVAGGLLAAARGEGVPALASAQRARNKQPD
eukprot:4853420-Alexandrium_andersonii.AAC.1